MRIILKHISILLIVFLWQINAFAQIGKYHDVIPDVPTTPALVHDFGNMLTADEEFSLEQKLNKFNNETSNELAIVIVDNLGEMEVGDFAIELGRKWDIGKASKRNGILLLVSKTDRKIFIAPGDKLQGALTDGECGSIIRNIIVPNFKAGNTYEGLSQASDKIIEAVEGEFTNDEIAQGDGVSGFAAILFILFFIVIFIVIIYSIRNKNNIYVSRRGYRYDDDNWTRGGGFGGGSDNDSGGGFGGFGGGGSGFDGGGASGSW